MIEHGSFLQAGRNEDATFAVLGDEVLRDCSTLEEDESVVLLGNVKLSLPDH